MTGPDEATEIRLRQMFGHAADQMHPPPFVPVPETASGTPRGAAWRLVVGLALCVLVAGAVAFEVHAVGGSGGPALGGAHRASPPATAVTTVSLPRHDRFDDIRAVDGRLLLSGTVGTLAHPTCVTVPVDPRTLALGQAAGQSCGDPDLAGEPVAPVNTYLPESNGATIRIARWDPHIRRASTGPVVMTYGHSSDANPVIAYGGGWLWVYDVATTNGPEVLQVSEATGQVVDTITAPTLYRPVMAADDDGLWLGNTVQGSSSPEVLYHVPPGGDGATGVLPSGPPGPTENHVIWLLATGHSVWSGIGPTYTEQTIWRFDGPGATPVFHVPDKGLDPTVVVGDGTTGLFSVGPYPPFGSDIVSSPRVQDVVRIDPASGAETVLDSIGPFPVSATGVLGDNQLASVHGWLFVLEPTRQANGYSSFPDLVRVDVTTGVSRR
jgi:hypothetical protein